MRVCYYNSLINVPWGCGVHGRALATSWREAGHVVLCMPDPLLAEDSTGPRKVGRLGWLPNAVHAPLLDARARTVALRRARSHARALTRFSPDVLITRRGHYDYSLDAVVGHGPTRYVAEVNAVLASEVEELGSGGVPPWERSRELRYLLQATGAVCVSQEIAEQLTRLGLPETRVVVLPNGVDAARFNPHASADPDTARWAARFRHVCGFAGTFSPTHDMKVMLAAAAAIAEEATEVGFLFVGSTREDLRSHPLWTSALEDRTRCTGQVTHMAVASHLAAVDILWAAFRNDYGSPLKLYEYLALGKPVVIAGRGLAVRTVAEAGGGIPVPAGDAQALATAMLGLIGRSPREREALGASGRAWVEGGHTWRAVADRFLEHAEAWLADGR